MKKTIYSVLIALTVLASCKRDYLDVNQNPNQAVTSNATLVISNALNVTGGRLNYNQVGAFWAGHWSPPTSVSGFSEERTYNAQASYATAGNLWGSVYDNIQDYNFVEKDALSKGQKNLAGIAQVMKAFNYQLLVDAYGNVPYSKSNLGEEALTPSYDDAKTIYRDLIPKLDVAIANLTVKIAGDNAPIGQEDIYFQGDMKKWVKFANTLKLRILMRESKITDSQAYITAQIAAITSNTAISTFLGAGSVFIGINDGVYCNPGYLKTSGKQNPFWGFYGFTEADAASTSQQFYVPSQYFRQQAEGAGASAPRDLQRIVRWMTPTGTNSYTFIGVPFGVSSTPNNIPNYNYSAVSHFGQGLLNKFNQPMAVMTASEALFLQAEARQLGLLTSGVSVEALFQDGVRASFILLKAGVAPIVDLVTGEPIPSPTAPIYTDFQAIPEDLAYDALKESFDANAAQATIAADNYMNYGPSVIGAAGSNVGSVADIVGSTNKLKTIMEQKFLCLYGFSGFEAWCDVRKYQSVTTGTSNILNTPASVNSRGSVNQRPLRLPYPSIEQQVNNANLIAATAAQGLTGSILDKPIFWDID